MTPVTAQDPQAVELYDTMMRVINVDLTSDVVKETMKRKKGESDADYEDRMQRYSADFYQMDQALEELKMDFDMQDVLEKVGVQAKQKHAAALEDSEVIDRLEDQLSGSHD
jgi:ribose 1,5-bisphosphokinase PhnN